MNYNSTSSVVLFAQGRDDHSEECLPGHLDIRVIGIHVELLRVHSAQFGVGLSDVVQVLHSIFQTTHHGLPVLCHFGVSHNGSVGGQVSKFFEVSLTPGAHNQKPGIRQETEKMTILIHINLSPQVCDRAELSTCPLDHIVRNKIFSSFAEISLRSQNIGPFWRTLLIGRYHPS
uniref:Uncharacterized protein n=1 Tax=Maylandia zebra TaxID=106582 RepID=A0A3P9D669_9CICH